MQPQMSLLSILQMPLAKLGTEYYLYFGAGLLSLAAFGGLILWPALGSVSRPLEKAAAGFLSLFILAALVLAGLALGFLVFYNWDAISSKI